MAHLAVDLLLCLAAIVTALTAERNARLAAAGLAVLAMLIALFAGRDVF